MGWSLPSGESVDVVDVEDPLMSVDARFPTGRQRLFAGLRIGALIPNVATASFVGHRRRTRDAQSGSGRTTADAAAAAAAGARLMRQRAAASSSLQRSHWIRLQLHTRRNVCRGTGDARHTLTILISRGSLLVAVDVDRRRVRLFRLLH